MTDHLLRARVAQVKTLYDICAANGNTPPVTLQDFEAAVEDMIECGDELSARRYVDYIHKCVHELVYAFPLRSKGGNLYLPST